MIRPLFTVRRGSLVERLLTLTVIRTRNRARAERSRLQWLDDGSGIYRLRVIGLLRLKVRIR